MILTESIRKMSKETTDYSTSSLLTHKAENL